ncbi:hypothetical protein BD410DRAFT_730668 [Rickenella mellea]|uniref:DH domain-containing protein n=1 Tax=Rickenella mellea TaxID=50990 RepID=A0A4Y7PP79_9AGAM|nr:hypothetical protein BD410DRAFT_730668 [Rickenella mellea]
MEPPSPGSVDLRHYQNWSVHDHHQYDVQRRGNYIPEYEEDEFDDEEDVDEGIGVGEEDGGHGHGEDDGAGVGVEGESGEKPLPLPPPPSNLNSPVKENPLEEDSSLAEEAEATEVAEAEAEVVTPPVPVMSKRKHALHELLMSERAYASDLAFIRDVHVPLAIGRQSPFNFAPPPITPPASSGSSSRTLSTASSDSSTSSLLHPPIPGTVPMTREDMKIIFSNVAELAIFSDSLADRLEEALGDVLESGQGEDRVGELFLEVAPKMEVLYKTYITRHPAALAHLSSLPQTPALAAYLSQTQSLASSVTHAWDLPSLLIKPVQRLLKYSLLLSTILEETRDGHGDKDNLRKARDKMEEVARAVNEGRRRLEVVKEVLTGKSDMMNPPLKKKLSTSKNNAGVSLGRIKGMRLTKPKEDGEESMQAEHVLFLEKNLKKCDSFIREFAKDAVQWSKSVHASIEHLRVWATVFSSVLGLEEELSSDAFNAFLNVVDDQLLPLCGALKEIIQHEVLPQLARLIDTMKAPTRLLTAMHSLEPLHHSLLNLNFSKTRPPAALLQASQRFVALRAQLDSELPTYLRLLDKGIVVCIRHFASRQTQFWADVRDRWGDLWDALRIEGETNAGSEETLRVWWDRFREVDEAVSKLKIFSREKGVLLQQVQQQKVYGKSGYSKSTGAVEVSGSSLGSPFYNVQALPNMQNGNVAPHPSQQQQHRHHAPGVTSRHHSVGSLEGAASNWSMEATESVGVPSTPVSVTRQPSKSRPRTPDHLKKKGRSSTSPYPGSTSASSSPAVAAFEISAPSPLVPQRPREESISGESVEWRGRNRSPSFRRRLSESLRTPLRHSPSNKSITSTTSASNHPHTPSTPPPNYPVPVPNITSHITADSPALYAVKAIHPCSPPDGASYLSLPFFELQNGDVFAVLSEAGHPSKHDGLPLYVDDGDDCLLIVRDEYGDIGWALASFVIPIT